MAPPDPTSPKTVPVRWGIIGAGNIARAAVGPAISWSPLCELRAVASRDKGRAANLADEMRAVRSHGSYQALVDDPDVEAVYIGLPNGHHEEWTIKCAEAGKHVLCEKSLALSSAAARRIVDACHKANVRLMEAFMYRHHPQWDTVRLLMREGRIGHVSLIRSGLCGLLANTADHRWSAQIGGGALYDVTCYAVNVARWLFKTEPRSVQALFDTSTEEKVDRTSVALLDFGHGRIAVAGGSLGLASSQFCHIEGTEGRIRVPRPFIPGWEPSEVFLEKGMDTERFVINGANHFLHMVEHFTLCVRDPRRSLDPGEDGLAQIVACEAVEQSALARRTIDVEES